MSTQLPAPRNFDRAAALFLASSDDFPFRWDGPARTWRTPDDSGRWMPVRFERVIAAATDVLEAALAADDVPLVSRRSRRVRARRAATPPRPAYTPPTDHRPADLSPPA